jgi:hypothetical protein
MIAGFPCELAVYRSTALRLLGAGGSHKCAELGADGLNLSHRLLGQGDWLRGFPRVCGKPLNLLDHPSAEVHGFATSAASWSMVPVNFTVSTLNGVTVVLARLAALAAPFTLNLPFGPPITWNFPGET